MAPVAVPDLVELAEAEDAGWTPPARVTSWLNLRHADDGAQDVFQADPVARFQPVGDRLGPDTRRVCWAVRIIHVAEVHIPRDLSVDADRLHLAENDVAAAFQHGE